MKTNKRSKIYNKGLRILQREMHRLDLISQGKDPKTKGLMSFQIADLVKLMKPLEATIKDDKTIKGAKGNAPSAALIQRAREILQEIDGNADEIHAAGSEGASEGDDGERD